MATLKTYAYPSTAMRKVVAFKRVEDREILLRLQSLTEPFGRYVKRLIRQDMNKTGQ